MLRKYSLELHPPSPISISTRVVVLCRGFTARMSQFLPLSLSTLLEIGLSSSFHEDLESVSHPLALLGSCHQGENKSQWLVQWLEKTLEVSRVAPAEASPKQPALSWPSSCFRSRSKTNSDWLGLAAFFHL